MEFFDKLGKKASEAYKMTADKTGKIAKETKIKITNYKELFYYAIYQSMLFGFC